MALVLPGALGHSSAWFSTPLRTQAFKKGGRRGAKKVMIVITDGESHDSPNLKQVIEDSEKDGITRYAIAVSLPAFSNHVNDPSYQWSDKPCQEWERNASLAT